MLKCLLPEILIAIWCLAITSPTANGQSFFLTTAETRLTSVQCPTDLPTLTSLLLKDLPSYANRVIQRSRRLQRQVDIFSYIVVASLPEFDPLPLSHQEYQSLFADDTQQIFFTTLEREYLENKVLEREIYHWLFLSQTSSGWQLARVYSRLGISDKTYPPSPPLDTTNAVIGQAIRLWLRDCRAGSLRSYQKKNMD